MDVTSLYSISKVASGPLTSSPSDDVLEHRRLVRAVHSLNQSGVLGESNQLVFHRDTETHRMVIQIVNRQTNEVVQQLPPEYVLRLAEDAYRGSE
jgi:uncharacterized FlaG/YvyC family protein